MTIERMADWSLLLAGTVFIVCAFVAMACLGLMCFAVKWAKGGFLFLPWESNELVKEYRRRFPNRLIYKVFSVSAISTVDFAGLGVAVVLWLGFGTK